MNSSMLAGERRWASARRGGMTVLGKVSVPKPINLPSQRLENHGLDPNVEIVPKGTVSWGSRSSATGSNPWTSSSLSPNADGGTVSPRHLSGCPSSGGSGTRPSTSGSDRTHDPIPNAWGSNSRPSSASGTLSSNQTLSASLRPRSAENRPNSSQLSRFAEPVPKSPPAWGSSVTAERLGVKSSREDGFALSSGDFPTLGSEKDNSLKITESEDHTRPSSAAGRINQAKEDSRLHADMNHGTVNTWRADGSQGAEDEIHPNMEKWQGDPNQFFNANPPPQHFDAWRPPPMNGPAGLWYGGRPRGPNFGPHVAPGGFPMEPYPYYHRPQIPPPPLAGSQPVPPGPRGPHPKNGDLNRPQMPDAYPRPSMPFRPGFYRGRPGPMAFEGYYGPPMGYPNSECDIPYMSMAAGPPVYNGYPPPNPENSNPHGRATGHVPSGKTMSEQVEADHWEDAHGPKRIPPKSHNEFDQREGGNWEWEQNRQSSVSHPGRSRLPMPSRKTEWGPEEDPEDANFLKRTRPSENPSHSYENRVNSSDSARVKSLEGMSIVKGVNDKWTNKSDSLPSVPPVVPPLPVASDGDLLVPTANKNSALMNKIDGLNAKFRASDGWNESVGAYNMDEKRNVPKVFDKKKSDNTGEVSNSNTDGSFERTHVLRGTVAIPPEVIVPAGDNPMQPISIVSRRPYNGGHGRVDHRGKGKFGGQDVDGWRRKPPNSEPSSAVMASNNEPVPDARADGPNIVGEASETMVDPAGKIEGDSVEAHDSTDIQQQRAKMREGAKQRALQLQKEEEERIREQKAKALAKLEELNRRTISGEAANQNANNTVAIGDTRAAQGESYAVCGPLIAELKIEESGFHLVPCPAVAAINKDSNANQAGPSVEEHLQMKGTCVLESNESPVPMNEKSHDNRTAKVACQVNDGGVEKHKRAGYKRNRNNLFQKGLDENTVLIAAPVAQTNHTHAATTDITSKENSAGDVRLREANMPNVSNTVIESPAQQTRKINRTLKTKPKTDEAPAAPALLSVKSETNCGNESIDKGISDDTLTNVDNPASTVIEPETGVQAQEACSSLPNEEIQTRVSNQWRPHQNHSRRIPKSQQSRRFNDKLHSSETVVWAPVRTQNKAKDSDEASQHSVQGSANLPQGDNVGHNNLKGKRAEMERYVPKPVAKELAQQGTGLPLSSSVTSSRSIEGAGEEQSGSANSASPQPASSATVHSGSNVEINEGDGSHNKYKRDHGAWKQRGSMDSSRTRGVHAGPSPTSEPTKDVHQSEEHVQSVRSEINTTNADNKVPVKDHGATGRGKRHPQRGPRNTGKNPDPENTGEIDGSFTQSTAASDLSQTDRNIVSKENRSFSERTSHWQPKSNPSSASDQLGSRTTGSESVTREINRIPKKDHPQHKESGGAIQSQPGQSVNAKFNVAESVAGHRQEFDREKKSAPVKGRPYSPSQDPAGSGESPANTGEQLERNAPSGSRRNGRQNNRPISGHESRGDWSSGYDNRQHNPPALRERHRQNMYYEYQPVGPVEGNRSEKAKELADGGADGMDQRHRERGHGHSKRGGNFYRRQDGGAVRGGSGRDC